MKVWQQFAGFFKKPAQAVDKGREPFIAKYQAFRELLSQNNSALELMAGIEEKISAPAPVDRDYMGKNIGAIVEGVRNVIHHLDLISRDTNYELNKKFLEINSEIQEFLAGKESAVKSLPVSEETATAIPPRIEGYRVLVDRGTIASRGIAFGKARVITAGKDIKDFPQGSILVAKHTSAKYAAVLGTAAAIITDIGGKTAHLSTLAREFKAPMIVNTEIATQVIGDGKEITVDALNGIIYEGTVAGLSEFSGRKIEAHKTPYVRRAERILKKIIPLNLVRPQDENFKPEFCETLHDIIRFAHQKAMREMFSISEEMPEGIGAVRLSGIPLAVYVIDLGRGIEEHAGKLLPDHIISIPFRAFLKGMSSVEWPEPRHVDVKGFIGMMAHTASTPEEELAGMGEESFSFISSEYMNFSIRLGYHLSVVEAYAGENINDNYIRFFFKGGGADIERRLRRVKLIDEILTGLDFEVKAVEDVIDAVVTKHKREQIEGKLRLMGKLTVYTKQMDAVMYDDASTSVYLEQFVREHLK